MAVDLRRTWDRVVERALRLGDARDWAIVGAAVAMLIAAILVTAFWTVTPKKRADGLPTVTMTEVQVESWVGERRG